MPVFSVPYKVVGLDAYNEAHYKDVCYAIRGAILPISGHTPWTAIVIPQFIYYDSIVQNFGDQVMRLRDAKC
jgi:hypothetical protein